MPRDTLETLNRYADAFNSMDEEIYVQAVPNIHAKKWMTEHIPRVLLPDPILEQTYYFRWWTFRKHIKDTPDGQVVTEFLPDVPWARKYNTIDASTCHHTDEGRWLRGTSLLDEYLTFMYRNGDPPRSYSNWLETAVLNLCETRGSAKLGEDLLYDMIANHAGWDAEHLHGCGLYWSEDDRDASEFSISGNGLRPTLNCYQYANEKAIAAFAHAKGDINTSEKLNALAAGLRDRINHYLWDESSRFYKVKPLVDKAAPLSDSPIDRLRDVREIWGYLPWRFGVAPEGRADAFRQLLDINGFRAAHGLTTAERRHPGFGLFYTGAELNNWRIARGENPIGPKGHECLWNGPSWPFSTCLTLRALANFLASGERQDAINAADYVLLLTQYAQQHTRQLPGNKVIPWIDENMNPDTGDWIARTRLSTWDNGNWSKDKGGYERGKDYNHSTFCDLVISGLFGVCPTLRDVRIVPLFPAEWPYAVLEDVLVHGRRLDIRYENKRLGGEGYRVFIDGECVCKTDKPERFRQIL